VGELSRVRSWVAPSVGDTWADLARRELSDAPRDEAIAQLQSWNLHVFMRAATRINGQANPILPSDVIFIEPPLPAR
jgi:hypothetical protein